MSNRIIAKARSHKVIVSRRYHIYNTSLSAKTISNHHCSATTTLPRRIYFRAQQKQFFIFLNTIPNYSSECSKKLLFIPPILHQVPHILTSKYLLAPTTPICIIHAPTHNFGSFFCTNFCPPRPNPSPSFHQTHHKLIK